ncbi:hypothetical protein, partial [Klebsiella pneumoniae]|uniref:hypothetical protein n=1 Tax=Klebsiella pneumoniae TaxID=573 RepID=UPI003D6AFBAD
MDVATADWSWSDREALGEIPAPTVFWNLPSPNTATAADFVAAGSAAQNATLISQSQRNPAL